MKIIFEETVKVLRLIKHGIIIAVNLELDNKKITFHVKTYCIFNERLFKNCDDFPRILNDP